MTTKRPYATNTKKRTYTVTEEDHEALRKLGNGNASAGIREAVKSAMEQAAVTTASAN